MNPPYSEPELPCKKNCKKKRCLPASKDNKRGRGHHIDKYVTGQIDFIMKAVSSVLEGGKKTTVVCLIPARTDTSIWHDYCFKFADEIRFIDGRLHFENEANVGNPAPFPSAVVVFNFDGFVRQAPRLSTMKSTI
jgi:hypothetical protein